MIKLDVISGFLGAGKTTVIKKLLASSLKNEKVVLIENEFGEIGIDGSFLKESGIEIKEINAGCICCSLVGDFSASLKEVVDKFNPDRIIIEPSGVGKLSDIVNAVTKVDAPLSINILCTVVDGAKAKIQLRNFGEFFTNQVAAASSIIVSKVDKITEEKLAEAVSIIKEIAVNASVITTSLDEIDPEKLLEFLESKVSLNHFIEEVEDEEECDDPECECHHHHHHHDEDEECCHHHHDEDEDEDEDEHCHHHHHDDDEECDDQDCECHHHEGEEGHEHHHHHHHHHHHADEVFVSWGIETVKKVSNEQLTSFLETLKNDESLGMILRSKGILKASDNDKWYYFDFVSGDYEIRLGEADYTGKLVVIGHDIKEEKIEELFNNL
ncbi:MAG: GTP-binding protein [Gammaproteobacteria bacterium]|nr:GTP-binding protein [Gammaproteobacteria bacterium]